MSAPTYRRWATLYDRQLAGEALSPEECSEIARLSLEDPASAHELAVRRDLSELVCELDDRDQAIVERALGVVQEQDKIVHLRQKAIPAPAPSPRRRLPLRRLAAGALGVAVAAAAVPMLWPESTEPSAPLIAPVEKPAAVELTFTSGSVRINGDPTVVGALALEPKSTVSVSEGHACLAISAETDVCLAANTEVVLDDQRGAARTLRLLRGRLVAVLEKRPARRSFSVLAGSVTATALGTAFAVEHDHLGSTQVTVMEGRVQVARTHDTARVVDAGEQLRDAQASGASVRTTTRAENLRHWALVAPRHLWHVASVGIVRVDTAPQNAWVTLDATPLGSAPLSVVAPSGEHQLSIELDGHDAHRERFRLDPGQERRLAVALSPPPQAGPPEGAAPTRSATLPPPSAQELLKRARSLVGAGDWQGAVAAYQRLRSLQPKSAESHTVLVALGQIQLDRLAQPRQALRSFEAYLKAGGGGLAQEARFGSVRALRALGDRSAEARAIRDYLRHHPKSVDAARLERRLTELP